MPLLFIDYTTLVFKAYEEKRDTSRLSQRLMHPTTANIKQECIYVYAERIEMGEEETNTLRSFFGVPPPRKSLGYVIERCKPDKFRPLQSFIRGEIKSPALVSVELLAWLIDFTPRPLDRAQALLGNTIVRDYDADSIEANKDISKTDSDERNVKDGEKVEREEILMTKNQEVKNPTDDPKNKKLRRSITIGLIAIFVLLGTYLIWKKEKSKQMAFGSINTACMYWAEDHYEAMPCNEERKDRLKLPMDQEKMKSFRKILREDTITEKSIGKIYYIKIDGKTEYYTAGGNHPINITRSLKPLSKYMYDTYFGKRENINQDSLTK
jgi:hypothetical protein